MAECGLRSSLSLSLSRLLLTTSTLVLSPPPSWGLKQEIAHRAASTRPEPGALKAKFLRAGPLPYAAKHAAVESYVMSRLLYNACTWSGYRAEDLHALDVIRIQAWRVSLGLQNHLLDPSQRVTDQAVWAMVGQPTAPRLVACARLSQLPALLATAPPVVLALAQAGANAQASWTATVMADLAMLLPHLPRGHPLREPAALASPLAIASAFKAAPKGWRPAVARLRAALARLTREEAQAALAASPPALPVCLPQASYPCPTCEACVPSKAALNGHRAVRHAYRAPLRSFAFTTDCVVCVKRFWTVERLYHHLQASKCGVITMQQYSPLNDQQRDSLMSKSTDEQKANVRAGRPYIFAARVAVRLPGPRPACFFA